MITAADKAYYAAEITSALIKLGDHYGIVFTSPAVSWDLRGKSRLGCADGYGLYIKLNPQYADLLGRDEYRTTVLHEACHIATTQRRKRFPGTDRTGRWSSHGAEWKGAMRFLGLAPDRCASVPTEIAQRITPARKTVRYPVYCACPTPHQVTRQMLGKVSAGSKMRCNSCKILVSTHKNPLTPTHGKSTLSS